MTDDPFQVLGISPSLLLSDAAIERAFLRAAASLHPDHSADPGATSALARLTEARNTLASPERRANALLARLGGPGPDDRTLPDGYLARVIAQREAIEESLTDAGMRDLHTREALAERRAFLDRLAPLFTEAAGSPEPGLLRRIRRELNAWRYLERLIEQLDPSYDPASSDFRS